MIANAERIHRVSGWTPRHDDLDLIMGTALGWARRLAR